MRESFVLKSWLIRIWDSWRSSFWFFPSFFTTIGVGLGILLPLVDRHWDLSTLGVLSWVRMSGDGARSILSALAGAMITVTSVIFSVTMVTLSLTTSQFGSRLLRTYSESSFSQVTLGFFLGTSVYCLLILRSIREIDDEIMVPTLSIAVGMLGCMASLFALIAFINYVADSIQAQHVVRTVASDLDYSIDTIYPDLLAESEDSASDEAQQQAFDLAAWDFAVPVLASSDGYLQGLDRDSLLRIAGNQELRLDLKVRPGNFVVRDLPLLMAISPTPLTPEVIKHLAGCFQVGRRRIPRQDVECAVHELVEVAVRALSPGINDPHTATACIDYLAACLSRLARRRMPSAYHVDDQGEVRIRMAPLTFPEVLDTAFLQIRQYGGEWPSIGIHLLQRLQIVAAACRRPADQVAVWNHANMILHAGERSFEEPYDLQGLRSAFEELTADLGEAAAKRLQQTIDA